MLKPSFPDVVNEKSILIFGIKFATYLFSFSLVGSSVLIIESSYLSAHGLNGSAVLPSYSLKIVLLLLLKPVIRILPRFY